MDVDDLAPALLGLADVMHEINNVVTKGEARITLRVKGGFKKGSFGIALEIVQKLHQQFIDLLNSRPVTAWATFLSLLS